MDYQTSISCQLENKDIVDSLDLKCVANDSYFFTKLQMALS